VIVSYQYSSYCFAWGSILLLSRLLAMMSLVSFTTILVYRFQISKDARVNWGRIGVFSSFLSRSVVFSRLCVLGSGAINFIF